MKNNLELYILDGCERCSRIKSRLDIDNIIYNIENCTTSDSKKCDSIEDKLDCGRYPIAIVKNNGVTSMIHFCDHKKPSGESTKKIPVDSEDKFINEIKNAYI